MLRSQRSHLPTSILLILVATLAAASPTLGGDDPREKKKRPDIYDRTADGTRQIAHALERAEGDNKRVLLVFGANWCSWCHKLHHLFATNKEIARQLQYEYELVWIDVDTIDGTKHNEDVDRLYGLPTKQGLPVLVVLDATGKRLTIQETGALEEGDHHDPKKVSAFLAQWKPDPISARETLSTARERAKAESRKIFLHFGAPWCGWCKRLDAYLAKPKVAAILADAFVITKIDVDRMTHGKEVEATYRTPQAAGLPFFVILDAGGNPLADSNAPEGNIGFPVEPNELAHFMSVVRTHGKDITPQQLTLLKTELSRKPRPSE